MKNLDEASALERGEKSVQRTSYRHWSCLESRTESTPLRKESTCARTPFSRIAATTWLQYSSAFRPVTCTHSALLKNESCFEISNSKL